MHLEMGAGVSYRNICNTLHTGYVSTQGRKECFSISLFNYAEQSRRWIFHIGPKETELNPERSLRNSWRPLLRAYYLRSHQSTLEYATLRSFFVRRSFLRFPRWFLNLDTSFLRTNVAKLVGSEQIPEVCADCKPSSKLLRSCLTLLTPNFELRKTSLGKREFLSEPGGCQFQCYYRISTEYVRRMIPNPLESFRWFEVNSDTELRFPW